MNTTSISIYALTIVLAIFSCKGQRDEVSNNDTLIDTKLSFVKVPLSCKAGPALGCGTRAKPILKDLNESKYISSTWINHFGDIIAVNWYENATSEDRKSIINMVLAKHKIISSDLTAEEYNNQSNSFKNEDDWYQFDELYKLSEIEAGIMANNIINAIKDLINNADIEEKMHTEIKSLWVEMFKSANDISDIKDRNRLEEMEARVFEIGVKYLGRDIMPPIRIVYGN